MSQDRAICRHFDPIGRKAGCEAGCGYVAPRDCPSCAAYDPDPVSAASPEDGERTRCEIWTRVMGYHRPVHAFNPGKQSEHAERRHFREPGTPLIDADAAP